MPTQRFAYYARLSAADKRVYRKSDAIGAIPLADPEPLRALVPPLRVALDSGRRLAVERATRALTHAILADLDVPPLELEVLEARPRGDYGELHGLYTFDPERPPLIQVWMRTAAKGRVVAMKTYLRTLLHEIGHHLDLHLFDLAQTFHTHGFYRRENDLFHQLMPAADQPAEPPDPTRPDPTRDISPPAAPRKRPRVARTRQLKLPF